jgi:hypothetical protein
MQKGGKMISVKAMRLMALVLAACLVQNAGATILTFDIETDDTYVGSNKNVPGDYGSRAAAADTSAANHLEGNGWTPNITVAHLPEGGVDHLSGDGDKLFATLLSEPNVTIPNFDFETPGDNFVDPPVWGPWLSNVGGARWWKEPRHGSTAPPEPETHPDEGQYHCAVMFQSGWSYHDLSHVILPDTTYYVSMDVRGSPTAQTGNVGFQLYAGAAHAIFLAQDFIQNGDVSTTDQWDTVDAYFTTAASGGGVGDILSIRAIQGDMAGVNEWAYVDNVQAWIADPNTCYFAARTDDGGDWDKVAKLSWDNASLANWDMILTPDAGFAVDLNSFELDPTGAVGDESGTWTVYQDDENGAVIDSGSWSNLANNSVVSVTMDPYAGPVLLRLNITGGTPGNMAIDNVNFDQAPVDCDTVYEAGYDMPADIFTDCQIDLNDFGLQVADWLLQGPADYNEKKLIYNGNENYFIPEEDWPDIAVDIQDLPFDGQVLVIGDSGTFYWVTNEPGGVGSTWGAGGQGEILHNTEWGRYTHNFVAINTGLKIDWFDDATWDEVLSNVRAFAEIGAAAGVVGAIFDPEFLNIPGDSPWQYAAFDPNAPCCSGPGPGQEHAGTYSFAEYEAKVRERGASFIDAIEEFMPNPDFMTLFWGSLLRERDFRTETDYYGLLNAFMLGILEGADPGTRIIDGDERAYYYTSRQAYIDGYNLVKGTHSIGGRNVLTDLIPGGDQAKYLAQVEYGSAIAANAGITTTATLMEQRVFWAMDTAERYVWFWTYNGGNSVEIGLGPPLGYIRDQNVDPDMPPAIRRARNIVNANKELGLP